MFESAQLGRKVSKTEFKQLEPDLHTRLLEVQRTLRDSGKSVILVVSGVEGAGKGEVVNRLNKWLDARGVQTVAFWEESDEEHERPAFWRFWRRLPPRGTVGILFGSWYTRPIINHVFGLTDEADFEAELHRIARLERMLAHDGAVMVKFWFHLSKKSQRRRLKRDRKAKRQGITTDAIRRFTKHYDDFARVSEHAIRATDTVECPWYIIESENRRYRDLTVGSTLEAAIRHHVTGAQAPSEPALHPDVVTPDTTGARIGILDQVDLSASLNDDAYRTQLAHYQERLHDLAWKARQGHRSVVAVFEGWDAAGKGGAIRRVTAALDARLFRVISVAAPTDEEKAQHYLWRFWRHVPRAGYFTLYDRSWYGRVLVERVEAFAKAHEWMRAYGEINDFEEQLSNHGTIVLKFWLHLDADEQLQRFEERGRTPWKQHKITDEDWRNREKWTAYEAAVNDMVAHTSTEHAPWTLIAGNDKRHARVQVVKTFCERMEKALKKSG
jgi:polyphosphate:AMP phosphotransferase